MGRMRSGFDEYARLLQQIGETAHQSCLLLTSRELPATLVPLEGRRSPVRTLRLAGLDVEASVQLLTGKDVVGTPAERKQLVEVYQGNPLALQIVAQTIVDVFGGEILPFLQQGEVVFGGVRNLLEEQFMRLSPLEQKVLLWLAILREPVSLQELLAVFSIPRTLVQVMEAVERLRRRSLIEQGQRAGSFTLQSVVLEYATARLIEEGNRELEQGQLARLIEHSLCLAQAKEYVRQTQEQLLVTPMLTQLQSTFQGHIEIEVRLLYLLDRLRSQNSSAQGYGPANLVTLLRLLRGHLRGLDLSRLTLRNVFLQGVDMQDSTLSDATMHDNIFTEPFDTLATITISKRGAYWAGATRRGDIRVWDSNRWILRHGWHAHTEMVWALAFSFDERLLASTSSNGSTKVWDVSCGTLLWEARLPQSILCWLAFSPDGGMLACAGMDTFVHLWNPLDGTLLRALPHASAVLSLVWSPDGKVLASGCADGSIWLWKLETPDAPTQRLSAHTHFVMGLAFSPDGRLLAGTTAGLALWPWKELRR